MIFHRKIKRLSLLPFICCIGVSFHADIVFANSKSMIVDCNLDKVLELKPEMSSNIDSKKIELSSMSAGGGIATVLLSRKKYYISKLLYLVKQGRWSISIFSTEFAKVDI